MNVLKVYFTNHKVNLKTKKKSQATPHRLTLFLEQVAFSNTTSLNAINF